MLLDRRKKRIAEELQAMFPQFNLDTIIGVVESETTSDASAIKLMEMDDQRNRDIAEQYEANQKQHEKMKEEMRMREYGESLTTRTAPESPHRRQQAVLSTPDEDVVEEKNILNDTDAFLAEIDKRTSGSRQPESNVTPIQPTKSSKEIEGLSQRNTAPAMKEVAAKTSLPTAPSYSDLASPAVDLLLRGFGGREKHAPERTSDYSLPAHTIEANLKHTITTNNNPPTPTNNQDLAARKEARRKARKERRERQQREREATNKLGGNSDQRSRRQKHSGNQESNTNNTHITSHSNKDRLLASQSTPALSNRKSARRVDEAPGDAANKMVPARQGASSGYDTGSEWHQENQSQDGATQDNNSDDENCELSPSANQVGKSERKAAPVKYVCGPKYDSSTRTGVKSTKPGRFESRKAKRYSTRRKTLTYDHYSTDRQDRTSL